MCYFGLVCSIVFSTAASVVDRVYHQKNNIALWGQRQDEIIEVADYMYRHFNVSTPAHNYTLRLLRGGFPEKHNRLLYQLLIADQFHLVSARQMNLVASQLDLFISHLPTLVFTSYHVRFIPHSWLTQTEVGMGIYEPGYFYTESTPMRSFSLQIDEVFQQPESSSTYTKIIAEVDGQRGRLIQSILGQDTTAVIWPRKSYFEIREKHYIASENTYLYRFKEITTAQARALPRIISTHNGEVMSMEQLTCGLP
jgi:hypothetical protein